MGGLLTKDFIEGLGIGFTIGVVFVVILLMIVFKA